MASGLAWRIARNAGGTRRQPLLRTRRRMSVREAECRICGADSPRLLGEVEYYPGFAWEVYDCPACGCRFTKHDDSIYDKLHASGAISYYNGYRNLASECTSLFNQGDAAGL